MIEALHTSLIMLLTRPGSNPQGLLVSIFYYVCAAGRVNPYPIIVYSVVKYRPHLSYSQQYNFKPRIFPFFSPYLLKFYYFQNPQNARPHSTNSIEHSTPLQSCKSSRKNAKRQIPTSPLRSTPRPEVQTRTSPPVTCCTSNQPPRLWPLA